jgi:hypothetical protein
MPYSNYIDNATESSKVNEYQAIDRLIANKHQRTPFRQTEYVGERKAIDPAKAAAGEKAWQAAMIAMAAGKQ